MTEQRNPTPVVGQRYELGIDRFWPTYVRLSEAPLPNGACVTTALGPIFEAQGWYVEFTYVPEGTVGNHRRFIPFHNESEEQ